MECNNKTYDKGRTLLLVCPGEKQHRVEHLDTGLGIDIDRVGVLGAVPIW